MRAHLAIVTVCWFALFDFRDATCSTMRRTSRSLAAASPVDIACVISTKSPTLMCGNTSGLTTMSSLRVRSSCVHSTHFRRIAAVGAVADATEDAAGAGAVPFCAAGRLGDGNGRTAGDRGGSAIDGHVDSECKGSAADRDNIRAKSIS